MADQKKRLASPGAVRLRIEALLDPSKTAAEIAEAVGSTNFYVHDVARIKGVKLRFERPSENKGSPWTERTIESLRDMWLNRGMTASAIAAEIGEGLTRNSVISKLHRLGLSGRTQKVRKYDRRATKPKTRPSTPGVSRPIAPKFAPDYVPPPPSEFDVARKRLVDLEADDCRFPVDVAGGGFGFCALEKVPGSSYCLEHARRCTPGAFESAGRKAPANDEREKATA